MISKSNLFKLFLILFFVLGLFLNCNPKPWPVDPDISTKSKFRVVNNFISSISVDFYLDDKIFTANIPAKSSSLLYELTKGTRNYKFTEAGKTTSIASGTISLDSGKAKYISVFNKIPSSDILIYETPNVVPPQNKCFLRFIHLSNFVAYADITLKSGTQAVNIPTLAYKSSSNYQTMESGNTIITIKNPLSNKSILINSFITSPNKNYSIYIVNNSASSDTNAVLLNILDESNTQAQNLINPATGISKIRFINTSYGQNYVNIWIDSIKTISQLALNSSSEFLFVQPGSRRIRTITEGGTVLNDTIITLSENKKYSFSSGKNGASSPIVFYEIIEPSSSSNSCFMRVINFSPSYNKLDVSIKSSIGEQKISDLSYMGVTNYLEFNTSEKRIVLIKDNNLISTFSLTPNPNAIYSLFISGNIGDTGTSSFALYNLEDSDTSVQSYNRIEPLKSKIKLINGLTDTSPIDFKVDGTNIFTNTVPRDVSATLNLQEGARNFKFINSSSQSILKEVNYNLSIEKKYLLIAYKKLSNVEPFLIDSDPVNVPTNKSSVRFINCIEDDIPLTISLRNTTELVSVENLYPKNFSSYYEISPGSNELTIKTSTTEEILLTNIVSLNSNVQYSIIIFGSSDNYTSNLLNETVEASQKLQTIAVTGTKIRLINASYDAPKLDLVVNNSTSITSIGYKTASKSFEYPSGKQTLKLKYSDNTNIIKQIDTTLAGLKSYYAINTNKIASPELFVVETPQKSSVISGNAIRFINCIKEFPSLDISITNGYEKKNISSLAYKSSSNYIDLLTQHNEIVVTVGGSAGSVLTTCDGTFTINKVYTVFLLSKPNANGGVDYSINFLDDANNVEQTLFNYGALSYAQLRLINASPNSTTFDFTLDGSPFYSNLSYGNSSSYLYLKNSLRNIKVYNTGSAISSIDFIYNFSKDKYYTLLVVDSVSKMSPQLIEDQNFTPEAGYSYVRFINESPNSLPLDVKLGTSMGNIKHGGLVFKQITSYEKYTPSIYSFVITESNLTTELASLKGFTLAPNKIYTFVIMGFRNGSETQKIVLKWFPDK